MSKMKKLLITGISYALVAALAIGGTVAYLQSEDSDVNVMTLGNVTIDQIEQERDANGNLVDFTQAKPAYPVVGPVAWAEEGVELNGTEYKMFTPDLKNVVDKIVTVKNTGKSDAYVRTIIAFECPEYDPNGWLHLNVNNVGITQSNWLCEEINGVEYCIVAFTYNEALAPNTVSAPSLLQVFLDSAANNAYCDAHGETMDILVISQAMQTAGFNSATEALNTAFGAVNADNVAEWFGGIAVPGVIADEAALKEAGANGDYILLANDFDDVAVDTVAPYSNYYGMQLNGGVLDGNGKTLDFNKGIAKNGKYDNYGIMTTGGTIKNADISGVFRGIVIMCPTEDLYIDNVTVGVDEDMCYGINTTESGSDCKVYVSNSTLGGWNSFGDAVQAVNFTNCKFVQGTYYTDVYGRLVKPYVNTVFENCDFADMYYIDLSSLGADQTVTLRNCTVNGVKLTAQNWTSLVAPESTCGAGQISIEGRNGSYMTASNVFDYVTFE